MYLTSRYGDVYLDEAVLYHVSRSDAQHNFSVYFYPLRIIQDGDLNRVLSLLAFVPQSIFAILLPSLFFFRHLPFCFFLQVPADR